MSIFIKIGKDDSYDPRADRGHVIGQIAHDRTMMRFAKENKGFDKGMQREIQAMERKAMKDQKDSWYAKKRERITQLEAEGKRLGIYK